MTFLEMFVSPKGRRRYGLFKLSLARLPLATVAPLALSYLRLTYLPQLPKCLYPLRIHRRCGLLSLAPLALHALPPEPCTSQQSTGSTGTTQLPDPCVDALDLR